MVNKLQRVSKELNLISRKTSQITPNQKGTPQILIKNKDNIGMFIKRLARKLW